MLPTDALIESIATNLGSQTITRKIKIPACVASFAQPDPPLPALLQTACQREGIQALYIHQVEALHHVRAGQDIVLVTRTSSGKTLAFNLPVLESLLANPQQRALYLFPLNALVNDQRDALTRLLRHLDGSLRAESYLGTLDSEARKAVRSANPHILLTNPEMLHLSLLGNHKLWAAFWKQLRFVVLDEMHVYRGMFGAHMAALLHRLQRIAAYYGATPQFITCSATVANPVDHVASLIGRRPILIDRDGSAQSPRTILFYNPPIVDVQEGTRRSYQEDAVHIACACVNRNLQVIVFTRARAAAERMAQSARVKFTGILRQDLAAKISAYRAGYLAQERQQIENGLRQRQIEAVFSTNALEAGIDVGSLDVAVLASLPSSVMSIWQQAGRAGRRGQEAVVVLVASPDPYDQFYVNNPDVLLNMPVEQALINTGNRYILAAHIHCLLKELPATLSEMQALPGPMRDYARHMLMQGALIQNGQRFYSAAQGDTHRRVSLRGVSEQTYQLYTGSEGRNIGSISAPQVYWECFPGAIYLHAGDAYRVKEVDIEQLIVLLEEMEADGYTEAGAETALTIEEVLQTRSLSLPGASMSLGRITLRVTITDFEEYTVRHRRRGVYALKEPLSFTLETVAAWITVPQRIEDLLDRLSSTGDVLAGALHSLEHLVRATIPTAILCDRTDIDGLADRDHEQVGPMALWFDTVPGGIGLAEAVFEHTETLFTAALKLVNGCPCAEGCPSCDHSGHCSTHNRHLNKQAAQVLLEALCDHQAASSVDQ